AFNQPHCAPGGPFGDHTGYYTPPEPFPVFHVTAMTMRRDAIYPSIVVGKPPQEDAWLGKATERIFLPAIRMSVPEIVDYDLPVAGAFHNCCIVSIRKAFPGHAQKVMHAIWGLGMLSLTKSVVVVDEWVNVHDYEEVFFRVGANVDPKRDVLISEGPLDHLDHAPTLQFYGGKLGIDATHKGPAEGAREWPPEIEMTDEIRRRVDERWAEYGLGPPPDPNGSRQGALRQLLRRGRDRPVTMESRRLARERETLGRTPGGRATAASAAQPVAGGGRRRQRLPARRPG